MKTKLLLLSFFGATFFANAQNAGIGTPTPDAAALLHVYPGYSTTQGFLVNGTFNGCATIPNLGTGSRMMFNTGKAAFRAGYDGTLSGNTLLFSRFNVVDKSLPKGEYVFTLMNMGMGNMDGSTLLFAFAID